MGLPNISAINLKQNFELGFQIYVQNLKFGVTKSELSKHQPKNQNEKKKK